MARNSIIKATITGDARPLQRALGDADTGFGRFARNATVALAGVAGAGAAVVAASKPLIDAASAQNEAFARAETIFGGATAAIDTFADTSAEALGVSRTAALKATGDFAGFFSEIAAPRELADLSTRLTTAAADFASFNDLTTDEALNKFTSALAGSSEVLRRYGIDTSAAAVEAKALELGLGDVNGVLTEQEKNLARSAIILDENNTFMGDFARTSDSLANQQRVLSARFEDVQAKLGEKLLPVAVKAAEIALDVIDAFEGVIEVFEEKGLAGVIDMLAEKFAWFDTARTIIERFVGYAIGFWNEFGDEISMVVTTTFNTIRGTIEGVVGVLQGVVDIIRGIWHGDWSQVWDGIKGVFTGAWDAITSILGGAATIFFELSSDIGAAIIDGIAAGIRNATGFVGDFVSGLWEAFKQLFNTQVVDRINNAIPNSIGLGPFNIGLPANPIPRLAKGGIVTGPTLALIGEAGPEAVIPLNRAGSTIGGPTYVTVNMPVGSNGDDVVRALRRYERLNGPVPVSTRTP